jgi:RNA polymerase sigma-70 factor (ECF subfamily)
MSEMAHPVTFERLLAHREWVRSVARSIAFDAATANDLEQETWLEALRSPPRDDRNLRGWLGTVLRNRARKRGRGRARRAHHEAAAPAAGPAPATADVVAEAEAQQRIVAAVLTLDEPYRTTVLLRFYEGLPPRKVGERMGVPAETVRTRVRRAAGRLREALGGEGTDLQSWMGAVTPLLAVPGPSSAAGLAAKGAVAVHTKKTIAAATVAAMLLGGVCAYMMTLPTATSPLPVPPDADPRPVELGVGVELPELRPVRRHVEPKPAPFQAPAPPPPAVVPTPSQERDGPVVPAPVIDQSPAPPAAEVDEDRKLTKIEQKRAKVRSKYAGGKEGFPFYDLVYWVDAAKLEDSRWSMSLPAEPSHESGLQLIVRWANEAGAAEGMDMRVLCLKLAHEKRENGRTSIMSYPFDNLGESVPCPDLDGVLEGFYEAWKRGAKDVLEDQCLEPRKSKAKVPRSRRRPWGWSPPASSASAWSGTRGRTAGRRPRTSSRSATAPPSGIGRSSSTRATTS